MGVQFLENKRFMVHRKADVTEVELVENKGSEVKSVDDEPFNGVQNVSRMGKNQLLAILFSRRTC